MGAGVGKKVRTCLQLYPAKTLMAFKYYSPRHLYHCVPYIRFKCSLLLEPVYTK